MTDTRLDSRGVELWAAPGSLRGRRAAEPVTVGLPLPKGLSSAADNWRLAGPGGEVLPVQVRALDRWVDGSIRWALIDFQATVDERTDRVAVITFDATGPVPPGPVVTVAATADGVAVDTGVAAFELDGKGSGFLRQIRDRSASESRKAALQLHVVSAEGVSVSTRWQRPSVEENGRLRAVVRIDGATTGPGVQLEATARLHFFAGSATVRLQLTVRNPRRARHPGGFWELGDPGSVLLKELSLVLAFDTPATELSCSVEPSKRPVTARTKVEVHQESSGGENWRSPNHVNRNGAVPLRFRGYRAIIDGVETIGLRATPVLGALIGGSTVAACVPEFWQNFPRAVSATPLGLTIAFWPCDCADLHELQGGEQKTHEAWFAFGPDAVADSPLDWCRSRLLVHASPDWYADAGAVPYLSPASRDPHPDYLALVNSALEGEGAFLAKREWIDEYGWRHFGDVYADHEAVNAPSDGPFVSHYNNQYDVIGGFAVQFLRSADPRWWHQMDELARHVVDIDIYHTDQDKSAYNHGLFWHSAHHIDAGRSTHRTYPKSPGVWGGGPSNEHDYTTGLLLHHFLTGSAQSGEAVIELARWVIDMDDGTKTVFRWLDRGATGLASSSGSTAYHGPGRGAGNSILTLLNAHTLTGERRYLEKAEQIIHRCVHPQAEIGALELLDAERKWFYTVFLQVLGKYLGHKADAEDLDASYAYGRASLLHFARWMAANEYPYLDKPEILEFPNETWAGQDMRKSEVFMHAALHAHDGERRQFLERAGFFFAYSTRKLLSMPSHVLTRPTVLMLVNGYMMNWLAANPAAAKPEAATPPGGFEPQWDFVPQRARAQKRAVYVVATAGAVAVAGGLAWLLL
jgi:hypothetical protein